MLQSCLLHDVSDGCARCSLKGGRMSSHRLLHGVWEGYVRRKHMFSVFSIAKFLELDECYN